MAWNRVQQPTIGGWGPIDQDTPINEHSRQAQGLYWHAPLMGRQQVGGKPGIWKETRSNGYGISFNGGSLDVAQDPVYGLWVPKFPGTGAGNSTHLIGFSNTQSAVSTFNYDAGGYKFQLNPQRMGWSIWVYIVAFNASYNMLFSERINKEVDPWGNWLIGYNSAGAVELTITTSSSPGSQVGYTSSNGLVTTGSWQHLCGSFDGSYLTLYKDGKYVGRTATSGPIANLTNTYRMIGSTAQQLFASYCVNAYVRDARLYNRALSAGDAALMYREPFGLWAPNIAAPYRTPGNLIPKAASTSINFSGTSTSGVARPRGATGTLNLSGSASSGRAFARSASDTINLIGISHTRDVAVSASTALNLAGSASTKQTWTKSASTSINFAGTAAGRNTIVRVSAATSLGLGNLSSSKQNWARSSATNLNLAGVLTGRSDKVRVSASTGINFAGLAAGGRYFTLSAVTSITFQTGETKGGQSYVAPVTGSINFHGVALVPFRASGSLSLVGVAKATLGNPRAATTISLSGIATARVVLNSSVPGLRTSLYGGISGVYPYTYTQTPDGKLLIANGIDPVIKWDGRASSATTAGVLPPTQALTLSGSAVDAGGYVAYLRFVDEEGNPSNLGPVSNQVQAGRYGSISGITLVSGTVRISSTSHGLTAGDRITITGVVGTSYANGYFSVSSVVDADTFAIVPAYDRQGEITTFPSPLTGSSNYQSGGTWTTDVTIVYTGVQIPVESKVVRRQILRNTSQQSNVFYLDIDTTDLSSTTFTSVKNDNDLLASEFVALFDSDGADLANVHMVPPNWKGCIISHLGRVFLAVDVPYTDGSVQVTKGSTTVVGIGTAWTDSFIGRQLSVIGSLKYYDITDVNETNQTLTLSEGYGSENGDATNLFAVYSIRPPLAESRLIYYSGPNTPEGWSATGSFELQDDGDELTGLVLHGSFLYILEERHLYRYSYGDSPELDGRYFLAGGRGCINQRCAVWVEGTHYFLDQVGVYRFGGDQGIEPVSTPIQTFFQKGLEGGQINWSVSRRYWHAAHDPTRDTIRWFISMGGDTIPRHGLCFNYRSGKWWVEEYEFPVGASTVATIDGRRSVVGSDIRRAIVLNEGNLDLTEAKDALRSEITSASMTSITCSGGIGYQNVVNQPVAIVSGPGEGQVRRIVAATDTRLDLDRPWYIKPTTDSIFQIGGIVWEWQSGWYRYADTDGNSNRTMEFVFEPVTRDCTFVIDTYFDHSATPRDWSYSISEDGVSIVAGDPHMTIDMTRSVGDVILRKEDHREIYATGDRYVSIKASGVSNADAVRLYQFRLNGIEG